MYSKGGIEREYVSATCLKLSIPNFSRLCFHTSLVHTHLEVGERKIGVYL